MTYAQLTRFMLPLVLTALVQELSGPFLNVISATGMALAGLGVIGLLFNSRPAMTWRA